MPHKTQTTMLGKSAREKPCPPYSAIAVANSFIRIAWEQQGEKLSPLKLQKLVYIAHGWHLAIYDQPLIRHQVEAWKYGPVIPVLYHEARRYGAGKITEYLTPDPFSDGYQFVPDEDERTWFLLRRIWTVYGKFSAVQLSAMTHEHGTPWHVTWYERGGKDLLGTDISIDLIKKHFIELSRKKAHVG